MKKFVAFVLFLMISITAAASDEEIVAYTGGTVSNLTVGTTGHFVTTQETSLGFEHSRGMVTIPYDRIQTYEYSSELARHLGVLPTIAVGLVKRRQRKHFIRIAYRDEDGTSQAAVFEVPKQMPQTLLAVLRIKAPQGCAVKNSPRC